MKEFYWDAELVETGEAVGGCACAENAEEAIRNLQSYGFYKNITVEEVAE